MIKQVVYNIVLVGDAINIIKDEKNVITITLDNKVIDIKQLYDNMEVELDDQYYFAKGLKRFEKPQNDGERIFNNTFDFLSSLLVSLNTKLNEIRERNCAEIFK